jgi:hypothetical protein
VIRAQQHRKRRPCRPLTFHFSPAEIVDQEPATDYASPVAQSVARLPLQREERCLSNVGLRLAERMEIRPCAGDSRLQRGVVFFEMASRFTGQMGSSINSASNSDFELEIEICELRGRRFR